MPRFDPTAFVKAKEKKQREIKMKLAPIFLLTCPHPCPFTWPSDLCLHLSLSPVCLHHLSPASSFPSSLRRVTRPGCNPQGAATPFPQ